MRRILFIFFFLASFNVSAADYYWTVSGVTGQFASASAACQASYAPKLKRVDYFTSGQRQAANCIFYKLDGVSDYLYSTAYRSGTGCTLPQVYNPATFSCITPSPDSGKECGGQTGASGLPVITDQAGECVDFPRADLPSQCKFAASKPPRSMNFFMSMSQDGNPQVPPNLEKFGCKVVPNSSASNCKLPAAKSVGGVSLMSPQVAKCTVTASFTGEVSDNSSPPMTTPGNPDTGADGPCPAGTDCTPKDPPEVNDKQPCNYVTDAEGRKVCSSSQYQGDPGSQNCGSVNGELKCITKPSSSTGSKTDTTVKTTPNSDGTTSTTKTDVHTQTNCPAGASSCKSTTTTTTTTTTKSADGKTTTSTNTQCTGPLCGQGSSTNGSGGGGAGNGNGDGEGCTTSEECSDGSAPTTPGLDEVDDYQQTTKKFYTRVSNSPLVSSVSAISVPSGGAAPAMTVRIDYLKTNADFGSIGQLKPIVDDILKWTMRAVWCFVAIVVFLMA